MKIKPVLETKVQRQARIDVLYANHLTEPDFNSFVLLFKEIQELRRLSRKERELIDTDNHACLMESLFCYDLAHPINEFEYLAGDAPKLIFAITAHGRRWLRQHNINLILKIGSFLGGVAAILVGLADVFWD